MADNKKIYQGHPHKSLDRFDNRSDTFTDRQNHRLRYQEGNKSSPSSKLIIQQKSAVVNMSALKFLGLFFVCIGCAKLLYGLFTRNR